MTTKNANNKAVHNGLNKLFFFIVDNSTKSNSGTISGETNGYNQHKKETHIIHSI